MNTLRPYLVGLLYLLGAALFLLPTVWVLKWYGVAVPLVVAWCAAAAFTVYGSRKRVLLGTTLGLIGAVLIFMLVSVAEWVPLRMIP